MTRLADRQVSPPTTDDRQRVAVARLASKASKSAKDFATYISRIDDLSFLFDRVLLRLFEKTLNADNDGPSLSPYCTPDCIIHINAQPAPRHYMCIWDNPQALLIAALAFRAAVGRRYVVGPRVVFAAAMVVAVRARLDERWINRMRVIEPYLLVRTGRVFAPPPAVTLNRQATGSSLPVVAAATHDADVVVAPHSNTPAINPGRTQHTFIPKPIPKPIPKSISNQPTGTQGATNPATSTVQARAPDPAHVFFPLVSQEPSLISSPKQGHAVDLRVNHHATDLSARVPHSFGPIRTLYVRDTDIARMLTVSRRPSRLRIWIGTNPRATIMRDDAATASMLMMGLTSPWSSTVAPDEAVEVTQARSPSSLSLRPSSRSLEGTGCSARDSCTRDESTQAVNVTAVESTVSPSSSLGQSITAATAACRPVRVVMSIYRDDTSSTSPAEVINVSTLLCKQQAPAVQTNPEEPAANSSAHIAELPTEDGTAAPAPVTSRPHSPVGAPVALDEKKRIRRKASTAPVEIIPPAAPEPVEEDVPLTKEELAKLAEAYAAKSIDDLVAEIEAAGEPSTPRKKPKGRKGSTRPVDLVVDGSPTNDPRASAFNLQTDNDVAAQVGRLTTHSTEDMAATPSAMANTTSPASTEVGPVVFSEPAPTVSATPKKRNRRKVSTAPAVVSNELAVPHAHAERPDTGSRDANDMQLNDDANKLLIPPLEETTSAWSSSSAASSRPHTPVGVSVAFDSAPPTAPGTPKKRRVRRKGSTAPAEVAADVSTRVLDEAPAPDVDAKPTDDEMGPLFAEPLAPETPKKRRVRKKGSTAPTQVAAEVPTTVPNDAPVPSINTEPTDEEMARLVDEYAAKTLDELVAEIEAVGASPKKKPKRRKGSTVPESVMCTATAATGATASASTSTGVSAAATRRMPQTCYCDTCENPPARWKRLDDTESEHSE